MNGFFIFNVVMTLLCLVNYTAVQKIPSAPIWARLLLLFFVMLSAAATAFSYNLGVN